MAAPSSGADSRGTTRATSHRRALGRARSPRRRTTSPHDPPEPEMPSMGREPGAERLEIGVQRSPDDADRVRRDRRPIRRTTAGQAGRDPVDRAHAGSPGVVGSVGGGAVGVAGGEAGRPPPRRTRHRRVGETSWTDSVTRPSEMTIQAIENCGQNASRRVPNGWTCSSSAPGFASGGRAFPPSLTGPVTPGAAPAPVPPPAAGAGCGATTPPPPASVVMPPPNRVWPVISAMIAHELP